MAAELTGVARLVLAGVACVALSVSANAAESAPVKTSRVVATLVTDTDSVEPGVPFQAGLNLQMSPGWHTYWQNPGDAGVAPDLAFELPPGSSAGPVAWPAPERVAEGDLTTFSYSDGVLLPVRIMPGAMSFQSGSLPVTLHASWLVCRDICVPEEGDFTVNLQRGTPSPSNQAALFAATAARVPIAAPFQARIAPDGTLTLSGAGLPGGITKAEFFPSNKGDVETAGSQAPVRHGDDVTLHLALGPSHPADTPLDGVLTLTAGGSARSFMLAATPGPAAMAAPSQTLHLLLLAALAGGLLLNLMPCVFPVLAMKAMALARLSAADRRTIRVEAGSYTAGVIVAFTLLGATLLAFRSAGAAVGWGFQLQSPTVVTVITWLLFATGLNMSGVFSIGEQMAGTGQTLAAKRGHAGSFFTGLLAVVVATPCTAAFMGVALAGALAAPAQLALLVFATMGLGLALPYAAIAALPRLALLLPRPGRWMATLRQALAFPMYGASAWLVWVVSQQTGPNGVLLAAAGLVGVGFAAWALGIAQASAGAGRSIGYAAVLAGCLSSAALLTVPTGTSTEPSEPFTPARLAELQSEGRPVFVNMTAAWCLSCLLNERIALSPAAVRDAFNRAHVAYLKGDWTRMDPTISAFLRDHDRDGVPLYVFYAPGRAPVILPQLLSEGAVLAQLAKLQS